MTFTEQLVLRYDDICTNKHGFNEQSVEANKKVMKQRDKRTVLNFIASQGRGHSKEIARYMSKPLNCISGRLSELKADGIIIDTGLREEGCAIYELNKIERK